MNLINWKTAIGVDLLLISAVLALEIKDMSKIQSMSAVVSFTGMLFGLTIIAAFVLIVGGLMQKKHIK